MFRHENDGDLSNWETIKFDSDRLFGTLPSEIRIKHFKAFKEEQTVPIKPITLIYGANSAGKSSIIQALLLLKQSPKPYEYLNFTGEYINLGSFKNTAHKHEICTPIEISLIGDKSSYVKHIFPSEQSYIATIVNEGDEYNYKDYNEIDSECLFGGKMDYEKYLKIVLENRDAIIANACKVLNFSNEAKAELGADVVIKIKDNDLLFFQDIENILKKLSLENIRDNRLLLRLLSLLSDENIKHNYQHYVTPDDVDVLVADLYIENKIPKKLKEILTSDETMLRAVRSSEYIGPLRQFPERFYLKENDSMVLSLSVGSKGEHLVEQLAQYNHILASVNHWFSKLGVPYRVGVKTFDDVDVSLYFLKLEDTRSGVYVSLPDVGFGIGQLMPVIVQAVASSSDSLIMVEQPEIHLHPKLQAEMADLFISFAKSEKKTFLLETHSEHLLLRIMRRIRETTANKLEDISLALTPDDVAVLYVESIDGESIVREMPLNEYGELVVPWPGGFFEEGLREMF